MKPLLTLILFCFSLFASGQDYQLFNMNTRKVFRTQDELSKTYSLVIDSVHVDAPSTVFYPYRKLNAESTEPVLCQPWGGFCLSADVPVWIGGSITQSGDDYIFKTNAEDSLVFDFTLTPQQSHIFYGDESQVFSINLVNNPYDTIHLGSFVDTVKRFRISHTDLQGNAINSALNNFEIIIGKELGLVNFFRIDSFPQVFTPVLLLGDEQQYAGFYELTNKTVYDHQPGDVIQYYEYYYVMWDPEFSYTRYSRHTFLQRDETADSLIYLIEVESFEVDSTLVTTDTINMKYLKDEIIASIPFDFPNGEFYFNSDLDIEDHFGGLHWTYNIDDYPAIGYCEVDNLWCSIDISGLTTRSYVKGLGIYSETWESVHIYPYSGRYVVYYEKDGIEYGKEAVVGVTNLFKDHQIKIIPNPAKDQFRIEGDISEGSILLIDDFKGQQAMQVNDYSSNRVININHLLPGVYILRLVDSTKAYSRKLVVQ